MKAGSQGSAFFFCNMTDCRYAGTVMKKVIIPVCAITLAAGCALAANTNAPVIIDANATADYVHDGSRTNRISPPVPGVQPLRSLRVLPKPQNKAGLSLAETYTQQATPAATAPRKPRTAADIAESNPNASYRFIDKRPLGMNPTPTPDSVYTLDDVPKEQQRNSSAAFPASLSPAR